MERDGSLPKIQNPSYFPDQARLRLSTLEAPGQEISYRVFAPIHGTENWRWWIVSEEMYNWYKQQFPDIKEERISL